MPLLYGYGDGYTASCDCERVDEGSEEEVIGRRPSSEFCMEFDGGGEGRARKLLLL